MTSHYMVAWPWWKFFTLLMVVSCEHVDDSFTRSLRIRSFDSTRYGHIEKKRIDLKKTGTSLKRFHPESVQGMLDFRNEECNCWQPVQDQFGTWNSLKKHLESNSEDCNLQECFLPVALHEGEGYLHIHRIGPKFLIGDIDELRCRYVTHMGPEGSFMKAYFAVPVDMQTMETLSYPPIHIHHLGTNLGDSAGYVNPGSHAPKRSLGNPFLDFESENTPGGVPVSTGDSQCYNVNDTTSGMGCLYTSIMDGFGWKVSKNRGPMITEVYVEDMRNPNSPPLETAVEVFTVWLTEPNMEIKSVIPASFGVWGTASLREARTLELPVSKDSVTMSSFTVPWKANFSNFYYHTHAVPGDEAWLVRGNLGQYLGLGSVNPSFVHVSSTDGLGNLSLASSTPTEELGYGNITMNKLKTSWARLTVKGHGQSRQTGTGKGSSIAPVSLLCRYTANVINMTESDISRYEQMYAGGIASGKYSQASRTGWRPGLYYRYLTESGPNCDTFALNAGEEFSLVQFSVSRPTAARQHIILFAFIHFEEESDGTKGWEKTPIFSKEQQLKAKELQNQYRIRATMASTTSEEATGTGSAATGSPTHHHRRKIKSTGHGRGLLGGRGQARSKQNIGKSQD